MTSKECNVVVLPIKEEIPGYHIYTFLSDATAVTHTRYISSPYTPATSPPLKNPNVSIYMPPP
jgi:hypothetical protein